MSLKNRNCVTLGILFVIWLGCRHGNQPTEHILAIGQITVQQEPAVGVVVKLVQISLGESGNQNLSALASFGGMTDREGKFEIRYNTVHSPKLGAEYALIFYWMEEIPPEGGLSDDRFDGKYLSTENPVKTFQWHGNPIDLGSINLLR